MFSETPNLSAVQAALCVVVEGVAALEQRQARPKAVQPLCSIRTPWDRNSRYLRGLSGLCTPDEMIVLVSNHPAGTNPNVLTQYVDEQTTHSAQAREGQLMH